MYLKQPKFYKKASNSRMTTTKYTLQKQQKTQPVSFSRASELIKSTKHAHNWNLSKQKLNIQKRNRSTRREICSTVQNNCKRDSRAPPFRTSFGGDITKIKY